MWIFVYLIQKNKHKSTFYALVIISATAAAILHLQLEQLSSPENTISLTLKQSLLTCQRRKTELLSPAADTWVTRFVIATQRSRCKPTTHWNYTKCLSFQHTFEISNAPWKSLFKTAASRLVRTWETMSLLTVTALQVNFGEWNRFEWDLAFALLLLCTGDMGASLTAPPLHFICLFASFLMNKQPILSPIGLTLSSQQNTYLKVWWDLKEKIIWCISIGRVWCKIICIHQLRKVRLFFSGGKFVYISHTEHLLGASMVMSMFFDPIQLAQFCSILTLATATFPHDEGHGTSGRAISPSPLCSSTNLAVSVLDFKGLPFPLNTGVVKISGAVVQA